MCFYSYYFYIFLYRGRWGELRTTLLFIRSILCCLLYSNYLILFFTLSSRYSFILLIAIASASVFMRWASSYFSLLALSIFSFFSWISDFILLSSRSLFEASIFLLLYYKKSAFDTSWELWKEDELLALSIFFFARCWEWIFFLKLRFRRSSSLFKSWLLNLITLLILLILCEELGIRESIYNSPSLSYD